ncbi:hypothetical protein ACLKA7_015000 [Drosophila subpalustris]
MPTVPAAAPFASVSACHATFMELIIPRTYCPTSANYLPFILYSISGCLPFTGTRDWRPFLLHYLLRMANCAPVLCLSFDVRARTSLSVFVSVSIYVMSVMSTHPFLTILAALFFLFACWLFVSSARLPS